MFRGPLTLVIVFVFEMLAAERSSGVRHLDCNTMSLTWSRSKQDHSITIYVAFNGFIFKTTESTLRRCMIYCFWSSTTSTTGAEQFSQCSLLSFSLSLSLSFSLCLLLSLSLSVCLSLLVSLSLSVCLPVARALSLSVSLCLSLCLSFSQSVCLSVCLSLSLFSHCLIFCLSLSLSASVSFWVFFSVSVCLCVLRIARWYVISSDIR